MNSDVGNRHSLPASGLKSADAVAPQSVLVVVPAAIVDRDSTQLMASCLINLLARQVGTISRIAIECGSTARRIPFPCPTAYADLAAALVELGRWTTAGRVPVDLVDANHVSDIVLHVGQKEAVSSAAHELICIGSGWRGWVGSPSNAPPAAVADDANPLGPFMAASLAAGEVFKRARGIARGRMLDAAGVSLWTGDSGADWDALADGPTIADCSLPPLHVVGAGAVGQALAYVFRYAEAASYLAVIDDDRHDDTNLNRCFLAGDGDLEQPKVDAVKRFEGDRLKVRAFDRDLAGYLTDPRADLDPRLAERADRCEFQFLVSCVDRGYARQQLQSLWPEVIFGGSTIGLVALSDTYRRGSGGACLACHNPAEKEAERIWSLRKRLGGMDAADLNAFLVAEGVDPGAVVEELARPRCGSDGAAALTQLARQPPEFSAGFVSLAAGVLLASNLLRDLVFAQTAPKRLCRIALSFLNGEIDQADLAIDPNCEQRCGSRAEDAQVAHE